MAEIIVIPDSDHEDDCKTKVLQVFEDICPKHLDELAAKFSNKPDNIIASLLDEQDNGLQYPKRDNPKKRKREDDELAEDDGSRDIKAKIDNAEYGRHMNSPLYKRMAMELIEQDFTAVPKAAIGRMLAENGSSVFRAYTAIDDAIRGWNDAPRPWVPKKRTNRPLDRYTPDNIQYLDLTMLGEEERAALDEFKAARLVRNEKDAKLAAEAEEISNAERAKMLGETAECGCCFDDFPINRMIPCEGETAHLFCRACMKSHAETVLGYQKYELTCMCMDGCEAGFSATHRDKFLDKKTQIALDRVEQQAMLRLAGIENLETCPFCPFAMEYPPVEENKEFRCENSECGAVSCRLCRKNTHIPKTCAEAALEEGHSARHQIEEAMSEAVIRKCNNCANPFIKQDGCNKISCTRCRTLQCYVCRKTVQDYTHFNDTNRGGKEGQCPLFDSTEDRHRNEAQVAEDKARQKVEEDNPDMDAEMLKFRMSEKVKQDDQRKSRLHNHYHMGIGNAPPAMPPLIERYIHEMPIFQRLRARVANRQGQAGGVIDLNAAPMNEQREPPRAPPQAPPPLHQVPRLGFHFFDPAVPEPQAQQHAAHELNINMDYWPRPQFPPLWQQERAPPANPPQPRQLRVLNIGLGRRAANPIGLERPPQREPLVAAEEAFAQQEMNLFKELGVKVPPNTNPGHRSPEPGDRHRAGLLRAQAEQARLFRRRAPREVNPPENPARQLPFPQLEIRRRAGPSPASRSG